MTSAAAAPEDKKPDPSQQTAAWLDWLDSEWQLLPPDLRDQVGQKIDGLLEAGDDDTPAPIDLP